MTTTFRPPGDFAFKRFRTPGRLPAHAAIAGLSFVAYILANQLHGEVAILFSAVGVSACGWAWLLTRALFHPTPRDAWWPRLIVGVVALSGAATVFAPAGVLATAAGNLYVLSGSAALMLTLVEPFQRHGCDLSPSERRFRLAFAGVFILLVGAAVLTEWSAPGAVKTACALVGLASGGVAVGYRLRHPLTLTGPPRRQPTPEDFQIAERLSNLLANEALHADPDLRIADIARRLREPEPRISRAVGALGFANFNRLINHYRIERAKQILASGDDHSILEIALDCGFGSIGPFNRAFKAETRMTPKAYRAVARQIA